MADGDPNAEAPVETAPAPEATANVLDDAPAGSEYEEFVFRVDDAAPATAPEDEAPQTPAPDANSSPDVAPEPEPEPADEDIERILKHPKAQERIDRLAANRAGNLRQQEQAQQAAREAKLAEATGYFEKLANDDFYDAEVKKFGRPAVMRWVADYEEAIATPQNPPAAENPDIDSVRAEFNAQAIPEFSRAVEATLPFYKELPESVRTTLGALRYDPEGNWLGDALTAVGKGIADYIAKKDRDHKEAVTQAREAGRNEAVAGREQASPIVIDAKPGVDHQQVIDRYASGDPGVSRSEYHAALRATGKTF